MDSYINNYNGTTNKPSLNKLGSKANFGYAAVHKTDVGDFKEGYFVMADIPPLLQQKPHKTHKTPERTQRKNDATQQRPPHQQRERSTKDLDQPVRDSELQFSDVRVPTSPTRSPPRNHNKRNPHSPQQVHKTMYDSPLSPPKPHKAHHEKHIPKPESFSLDVSGTPQKDKGPSPPSSRWAGPAFSNAPPPSSLPMPEFPPFQSTSPTVSPLSSSPPQYSGAATYATIYTEPQLYIQPPVYAPRAYPVFQYAYADPLYEPENLAQLSTDLRRMLNISQPIPA